MAEPVIRLPHALDLNGVINSMEVKVLSRSDCQVCAGWSLAIPATDLVGMHYSLTGDGQIAIGDARPVPLPAQTPVIVPPGLPVRIDGGADVPSRRIVAAAFAKGAHSVQRYVACIRSFTPPLSRRR